MPQDNENWNGSANMFQYGAEEQGRAGQVQDAKRAAAATVQDEAAEKLRPQAAQPAPASQQPQYGSYQAQAGAAPPPQQAQQASQIGARHPQVDVAAGQSQAPYQFAYQYAPVQPRYAESQKKSRAWIVAIVFVVCLFAAVIFGIKSCTDSLMSGGLGSSSDIPDGNAIAVIDISGTIQYDGTTCSPEGLKKLLDQAEDADSVKAVVLRVDSGGGTATAGEEMAAYVRDFSKPLVVSSASINASAAYELSSQADYIYVAKSTEIGAIGTAMELTDLSGLFEMLGVNMDVIASADSKDSSYGYRPLTDEEREYYQRMVDQINDVFVQNVADGRKMPVEAVRELATGLPFTGLDAVENGLADAVGTREDAIDYAAQLAGVSAYKEFDLSLANYDLSGLADLLGSSSSLEDLMARSSIKQ